MRFANALHLYRVRLRARLLQECFAVVGIAAGVGLLFASQIASSSLSSSVGQLNSGIVGGATLQLSARDAHGFGEKIVGEARALPGVRVAAPLLEVQANARGPKGERSVQLVGADENLIKLGGALVRKVELTPFGNLGLVVLPSPVAQAIGVGKYGQPLFLQAGGNYSEAALYARLSARQIGPLVNSPIAVAPLEYAQEASGLQGKVTRILIESAPGREAGVRAGLERLAAGRLTVESSDYDERLFAKAAAATNQSTQLFAVISALVGFLFAFNAMLLTVPQRRRLIADLRRDGYTPRAVIGVLMLDALVLGAIACAIGLVLGDELSIHLFHSNPGYLSSAFAVGSERVVNWQSVAVAAGGGMAAASVAVLSPLRDIVSRNPLAAVAEREQHADGVSRPLTALGLACLAATLAILLAAPQAAIAGMVTLIAALLALLAIPLAMTLGLVRRLAPSIVSAVPHIAVMELRAGRSRAIAIAATGAIAVFGSVSIQGAHSDLLAGLYNAAEDANAATDVWVSAAGDSNLLMTSPVPTARLARLRALPGVREARVYRGGLLDWGDRRVWVIAPPRDARPLVPPSQLVEGNVASADARVRAGGWAVVSLALAQAHKLKIGDAFALPSPEPSTLPGGGGQHEHRLGAGGDRDERRRLRAGVELSGRRRLPAAGQARRATGAPGARSARSARR